MTRNLLVVAGGASGDRAAAAVVSHLQGVSAYGLGGGALEAAGVELLTGPRDSVVPGIVDMGRRAIGIARAYTLVRTAMRRNKPAAALLVRHTALNVRLALSLHASQIPVLWYGAPPGGAWKSALMPALRRAIDRMAVMLPFEEAIWRDAGVHAHYVGHPAIEERRSDRIAARELFGMTPRAWAIAILPGSEAEETRRLLPLMLAAYQTFRKEYASVDARVLLAPTLDAKTRLWAHGLASTLQLDVVDVDPRAGLAYALPAFDAALCAVGTVSLECALARVIPVVCRRVGLATAFAERTRSAPRYVAPPNVLLNREAFPELLQQAVTAERMAEVLGQIFAGRDVLLQACAEVEAALGTEVTPSLAVARMLAPWLGLQDEGTSLSRA